MPIKLANSNHTFARKALKNIPMPIPSIYSFLKKGNVLWCESGTSFVYAVHRNTMSSGIATCGVGQKVSRHHCLIIRVVDGSYYIRPPHAEMHKGKY